MKAAVVMMVALAAMLMHAAADKLKGSRPNIVVMLADDT